MTTPVKITLHGVFLEIYNLGVMLAGPSGIGKSELGLGLINRGHRLIADDAIELTRVDETLNGSCHPILQDFLEVRGLGPLNIRAMYGKQSIKASSNLDLIIYVNKLSDNELINIDRLHGLYRNCDILGVIIPEVTIPVAAGRDLVILVEAAAMNQKLKMQGYHAGNAFIEQQEKYMQEQALLEQNNP